MNHISQQKGTPKFTLASWPHSTTCNSLFEKILAASALTIRESLSTDVWTKAKLKLHDFVKMHHQTSARVAAPLFRDAVELFKQELASDSTLKPQSKKYRHP